MIKRVDAESMHENTRRGHGIVFEPHGSNLRLYFELELVPTLSLAVVKTTDMHDHSPPQNYTEIPSTMDYGFCVHRTRTWTALVGVYYRTWSSHTKCMVAY